MAIFSGSGAKGGQGIVGRNGEKILQLPPTPQPPPASAAKCPSWGSDEKAGDGTMGAAGRVGVRGNDGHAGGRGGPGGNGEAFTIDSASYVGTISFDFGGGSGGSGGVGGAGGQGQQGQDGQQGGEAGPIGVCSKKYAGKTGAGGKGGNGGPASDGGPGGPGGNGGDGGHVTILYKTTQPKTDFQLAAGPAGVGGQGGQPGLPGVGGAGGENGEDKPSGRAGDSGGASGRIGPPGDPGQHGQPGSFKFRQKPGDESQDFIYQALTSATFDVRFPEPPRREQSICYGEIPVTYSLKYGKAAAPPSFRMVLEPGGIGINVASQIDWSLRTLDGILSKMGWLRAADTLNRITPIIHPKDAEDTRDWHGGMWLGMDASNEEALSLKVYMNLRHGSAQERWQRVANVVSKLGSPDIEPVVRRTISDTQGRGIPVGIGFHLGHKGLTGIRLYVCLFQPASDVVALLCDSFFPSASADVKDYCNQFEREHGEFKDQSVTLGYDFATSEKGRLTSRPVRFKAELACFGLTAQQHERLPNWFEQQLKNFSMSHDEFTADLNKIRSVFSSYIPQYVTLGVKDTVCHLTFYLEPCA